MGGHGVDVDRGRPGRHRAESRDELRDREVDLLELLELLAVLRSGLADGAGDRADGERADGERADGERADGERADGERADRERADGEREGRHSAARASAGSRPWTASTGRHAAERQALRQPLARSGRHRAPGTGSDPVAAGGGAGGGLTGGGVMTRWSSVAAILERATAHETPVSALARETSVVVPVRAVREPGAPRPVADEVAERWTAEQWMPTQRRSEAGHPAARPVGWHPVPRPRPAAVAGPVIPSLPEIPEVPDRLAG